MLNCILSQKVFSLFLFLGSLLCGLLIAELLTRLCYPQITSDQGNIIEYFRPSSTLPFELQPNFNGIVTRPDYDMTIHINSLGYRGREFSSEKPASAYRILVIGDSFTFGLGVNDEETFPVLLEELLNKAGDGYQVINAGYACGFSPDAYYAYLLERGLPLRPDMIVVALFVWNDITDLFETEWIKTNEQGLPTRVRSKARRVNEKGQFVLRQGRADLTYVFSSPIPLLAQSHFYSLGMRTYYQLMAFLKNDEAAEEVITNYSKNSIYSAYTIHQPPYPKQVEQNFQQTLRLLAAIQQLSRNQDISLMILLIPPEFQVHPARWEKYRSYGAEAPLAHDYGNPNEPQTRIMTFCSEHNIRCLDLLPAFRNMAPHGPLYLPIDGHWNQDGHRLAAASLAAVIEEGRSGR